jgi:hypothetical protein
MYSTEKARNMILNINNSAATMNRAADTDGSGGKKKKKSKKGDAPFQSDAGDDPTKDMPEFKQSSDAANDAMLMPSVKKIDMSIFEMFGPPKEVDCITAYDNRVRAALARQKRREELQKMKPEVENSDSDSDVDMAPSTTGTRRNVLAGSAAVPCFT